MSTPCNTLNVKLVKTSALTQYSNLKLSDFITVIESGSTRYSRRSTLNDLVTFFSTVTGSYSGSFTGSFKGYMSASDAFSGIPAFHGTSSHAVSASYSLSSSTAENTTSSSYSLSSSFARTSFSSSQALKSDSATTATSSTSASYSLSSSHSQLSNVASSTVSASYSLSSSFSTDTQISIDGLGMIASASYKDNVSSDTVNLIKSTPFSINHGFGKVPALLDVTLICTDSGGDLGYAEDDEINVSSIYTNNGSTEFNPITYVRTSSTVVVRIFNGTLYAINTSGALTALSETKWNVRVRAWK